MKQTSPSGICYVIGGLSKFSSGESKSNEIMGKMSSGKAERPEVYEEPGLENEG